MLAPLFDRMTTHIISERFTANEAYDFCEMIRMAYSNEDLEISVSPLLRGHDNQANPRYWDQLDSAFVAKWSFHRTPPKSIWFTVCLWLSDRFDPHWTALVKFCRLWLQYGGRKPEYYETEHEEWLSLG